MGYFDHINFKMFCPKCSGDVDGFQSKDEKCNLETLEYYEVDCFYSICDKCDLWIEFRRKEKKPIVPITDYQILIGDKYEEVFKDISVSDLLLIKNVEEDSNKEDFVDYIKRLT